MENPAYSLMKKILFVFIVIITIAGCTNKDSKADTSTLIVSIGGESEDGYDPTLGWGRYGNPLFQSTLLKRNDQLAIVNDLAVSYAVSTDGLVWNVKLRNDVRFSDGVSLTAEDVVYTFLKAKDSGGKVDLTVLETIRKKGNYELEFVLKNPSSTFIVKLITLGIVPKHAHGETYSRNPVGSGPYKLVNWQEGQQMIVEENPYYYGEKPEIKRIVFIFSEEDAVLASLKAGKIHLGAVPQDFAVQKIPGYTLHIVPGVDNRGIMFPYVPNTGEKTKDGYSIGNNVTSDITIRKAIEIIIDKQLLVDTILSGFGSPAYGIADNLPWDNPDSRLIGLTEEDALGILEKAGWKDTDRDGIREKNGLKAEFRLIFPASDSIRQSLAVASADMMKKIGIHAIVEGKSWDEIRTLMHSNAILFGWGSHDPTEMYNVYHSKYQGEGWYNTGYYKNETVDAFMDKAMSANTYEESLPCWKLAQWDGTTGLSAKGDVPWVWLVNLEHTYFVSESLDIGISRIEPHGHGWPITANITKWKWKK
ncbi:MAG: ABC transporter substrate-binding protein [Spirochaetales bacterium]|nr:ABC transporter substrate-binding protein [Spirochaetales bacterium]